MSSRRATTMSTRFSKLLLLLVALLLPATSEAAAYKEKPYDVSRPFPEVRVMYQTPIPTCPGKTLVGIHITLPPNAATPPHTQRGAFITAHLLSGYIYNAPNNSPAELLGPGDTLKEYPGWRHRVSENASKIDPAVVFAVFIVDSSVVEEFGPGGLVLVDEEWRGVVMEEGARRAGLDKEVGEVKKVGGT